MNADWIIIGARLVQFTSTLVLFGSSLFFLYGFDYSPSGHSRRGSWPSNLLLIAALTALAATAVWVMGQTASLTDEPKAAIDPASLWLVLSETRIGRICLLRFGLLVVSIAALLFMKARLRSLSILQMLLGGILVASFAWSGHGARDHGGADFFHLGADILHLLAAGIWIGALAPLTILILYSHRTPTEGQMRAAHIGLDSFSRIGLAVVATLIFTGLINSWFLIGLEHWRGLFTTSYGIGLLVKLALFGLMLLLATANRYWLTPQLAATIGKPNSPLTALRASVLTETILAALVLAAVAFLGTQPPLITGG